MKRSVLTLLLLTAIQLSCKKDAHQPLLAEYLMKDFWMVVEYTCDGYHTPEDSAFMEDSKNYKLEFKDAEVLKATNVHTNNVLNGTWKMLTDSAFSMDFGSTRLAISGSFSADTITAARLTMQFGYYDSCRIVLAMFN